MEDELILADLGVAERRLERILKDLKKARSAEIDQADFEALRAQGFSDSDIWDIGSVAAFFNLSNRMANVAGMRPNPEFYTMGRGQ